MKDYKLSYIIEQTSIVAIGSIEIGYCLTSMTHNTDFRAKNMHFEGPMLYVISIIAILAVGALFGSILVGIFSNYSRRIILYFAHAIMILGAVIQLLDRSRQNNGAYCLYFGKAITGIGMGIFSVIIPVILKELGPKEISGAIVGSQEVGIAVGWMISTILQSVMHGNFHDLDRVYWRIIYGFPIPLSLLASLLILIFFKYETPRYSAVIKDDQLKAREALNRVYSEDRANIELDDLKEIRQIECLGGENWSWNEICSRINQRPLIVGCILCLLKECTGMFVFFIYLPFFFAILDDDNGGDYYIEFTIGLAVIKVASALFCIALVDRIGRKRLLLIFPPIISFVLIVLFIITVKESQSALITAFLILLLYLFVFCYELSYGTIMWVYLADLLPAKGVSIGLIINWICLIYICLLCFFNHNSFSNAQSKGAQRYVSYVFLVFAILTLMGVLFVKKYVFESKNMDERTIKRRYLNVRFAHNPNYRNFSSDFGSAIIRSSHNPDLTVENRVDLLLQLS